MVKIVKSFQYLYPAEKKVGEDKWETHMLQFRGKASLMSRGQHPIFAGWYRLQLAEGIAIIDIEFTAIIDNATGEDLLETWKTLQYAELLHAATELCRSFIRSKFLS